MTSVTYLLSGSDHFTLVSCRSSSYAVSVQHSHLFGNSCASHLVWDTANM